MSKDKGAKLLLFLFLSDIGVMPEQKDFIYDASHQTQNTTDGQLKHDVGYDNLKKVD